MKSKILSLNVGHPVKMEWRGKTIVSSMFKHPTPGPLQVHQLKVDGDSFANPQSHGTPDSVLYVFGMKSILEYMQLLGRSEYSPGALGENITVEDFDEHRISVGDVFRAGDVEMQATFPRIPCGKVNLRMEHAEGQKCMQQSGRSGVYMRILKVGQIGMADSIERLSQAAHPFFIADVYDKMVNNKSWSGAELERMQANGAFPEKMVIRLKEKYS